MTKNTSAKFKDLFQSKLFYVFGSSPNNYHEKIRALGFEYSLVKLLIYNLRVSSSNKIFPNILYLLCLSSSLHFICYKSTNDDIINISYIAFHSTFISSVFVFSSLVKQDIKRLKMHSFRFFGEKYV